MMKLCSQLSLKRSLYPGKCHLWWCDPDGKEFPLAVETTTVLGAKGGYNEGYQKAGAIKNNIAPTDLAYGNPHLIQRCYVPAGACAVVFRFLLKVAAHSNRLYRCNDPDVAITIERLSKAYYQAGGYRVLARRYLENILLGTWLWDNRFGASLTVTVYDSSDTNKLEITDVQERMWNLDLDDYEASLNVLVNRFELALVDPRQHWRLVVEARLEAETGEEIFPSQAFVKNDTLSKRLATSSINGVEQAVLTSQKIGAGIQQIDDWIPSVEQRLRVSSYGVDRSRFTSHRHPNTGLDLYSLLQQAETLAEQLESKGDELETETMNKIHFLMACLVGGGMMQAGGDS